MVRRRQRPLSFPFRNAPMVMLVLPASSASSIWSDRAHAAGQDFRHRSIILPEQQETARVESTGDAFEDQAILVDPDSSAVHVRGSESERFANRLRPALRKHAAGGVDSVRQRAKQFLA